jgi:hypothetical protein
MLDQNISLHKITANDFKCIACCNIDETPIAVSTQKSKKSPLTHAINLKKACYHSKITGLLPNMVAYQKVKLRNHRNRLPLIIPEISESFHRPKSISLKERAESKPRIRLPNIPNKNTLFSELSKYKIKKKFDSQVIDQQLLKQYLNTVVPKYSTKCQENEYHDSHKLNKGYKMYLIKKRYSKPN